jgi:hypothetical protein
MVTHEAADPATYIAEVIPAHVLEYIATRFEELGIERGDEAAFEAELAMVRNRHSCALTQMQGPTVCVVGGMAGVASNVQDEAAGCQVRRCTRECLYHGGWSALLP